MLRKNNYTSNAVYYTTQLTTHTLFELLHVIVIELHLWDK